MVAACLEEYFLRGRWRQPEVLHVDDSFPIDTEVMSPGHLLTYIEQQRIFARLGDVQVSLEHMALAHFLFAAFGRGDIHGLLGSGTCFLVQPDKLVGRVEVCLAIVIPQHAITFARENHGDGYLCVHLCEPARQSPHVQESVLKLSEAIEILIFG